MKVIIYRTWLCQSWKTLDDYGCITNTAPFAILPLLVVIRCPGWFLLFAANVRLDVIIV
jgi:hypothetical protein